MRAIILAMFVVLHAGSAAIAADSASLARTFERGFMTAPASTTLNSQPCESRMAGVPYACLNKIDVSKKYPVIVYMHGCDGLHIRNLESFKKTAITVSPNSFARPKRRKACELHSDKKDIMALRFTEVENMVEELKKLPWVDTSKLILAGFSEGGVTAALYSGDEFAGRIILGWVCASRGQWWVGINGSRKTPVLAVVGKRDKYYQDDGQFGHDCGEHFRGRPNSQSIVIKEGLHNILGLPVTRDAIKTFVANVTK